MNHLDREINDLCNRLAGSYDGSESWLTIGVQLLAWGVRDEYVRQRVYCQLSGNSEYFEV